MNTYMAMQTNTMLAYLSSFESAMVMAAQKTTGRWTDVSRNRLRRFAVLPNSSEKA